MTVLNDNYKLMRFNIPTVTKNIIMINALVMVMMFLRREFMIEYFALFFPTSPFFKPWQIITHMFLHGNLLHIFFNMYTFFIFGSVLERVWGPKKFALYFFVTGIGAALLHMGVQYLEIVLISDPVQARVAHHVLNMTPTVGASGAVYGLLLGYGMLYPDATLTLIFPPVSMKAKWFVLIFAAIELTLGLSGKNVSIAHFAHLGGMLFGLLLILYWRKKGTLYRYE